MSRNNALELVNEKPRTYEVANTGDELLGALSQLPGIWKNEPGLEGRGWNMIALPFVSNTGGIDYRVLMNQYNEELAFERVGKGVPNRGVVRRAGENKDQLIVTLDFEQTINQISAEDMPPSGLAGAAGLPIHHEPGLWLNMINFQTNNLDVGRLGTIPHGNSVLALGTSEEFDGPPTIPNVDVLPTGATRDINNDYLAPYKHFRDNPFKGLFNVLEPHTLLKAATPSSVKKTTKLEVSTAVETAGILNIPFIQKHADTSEMQSTFWIMELNDKNAQGEPIYIMQYMQVVILEFFERSGEEPGLIRWPHVSFNTMRRFTID